MSAIKKEQNKFEFGDTKIFGRISKIAMLDGALSSDAKGLYALLCTYSLREKITASSNTLAKDLNIGRKKLCGLLLELSSQDYISVAKVKSGGKFTSNSYKLTVCPDKYFNMIPEDSKKAYALEKIKAGGIQSYGYGLAEQRVLCAPALHITAKAIYAYFCALSGNTGTAYPSVHATLRDLQICESTYYKYFRQLVEKKYVQVIEHKSSDGRYSLNEYKLLGHPNRFKESNYEANIAAVSKKIKECDPALSKKDNAPSLKSDAQPYPKTDARCENKKESAPFPKSDTWCNHKNDAETTVKPLDSQRYTVKSVEPENPIEPNRTKPSAVSPSPIFDTLYNKNNVNINSQNKNTLNQAGANFEKKSKPSSGINQSTSKKSDLIDELAFENYSVNSDKVYQDLLTHKGIPLSCLKNKSSLEVIIKKLSDTAETPKPKMPKSQEEFFIKKGLMSADARKPEDNKLRRLFLKCLVDMLHDSGNYFRKYNPEEIAGFVNSHIKIANGAASFDNWLEQFEKSFMQSASKPEVYKNIKNPYAYIKTSLEKFLRTYSDFYFDFTGSENKKSSFDSDMLFDKIFRNSSK